MRRRKRWRGRRAGTRRSAGWRGPRRWGRWPAGAAQSVLDEATIVVPLAGLIDLDAERARLDRDRMKAEGEAEKVARKLANADFVARAPEDVVAENRERLEAARAEAARLKAALRRLG